MPVVDGVILPLVAGAATVRVQDMDTSALTEDTLPVVNAEGTRLEDGVDETIVSTSDNVVAQLEAKTGNDRLDAQVALRDLPGLNLNGSPILFQPGNTANVSVSPMTGLPVTINAFDMFEVSVGGTAFGQTVAVGSFIIALIDTPSLLTTAVNDWFVLQETVPGTGGASLTVDQALLLQQFTRQFGRFDWNANVFVDPANVRSSEVAATGLPLQLSYEAVTTSPNQDPARTAVFNDQALQLSNIADAGGSMQIAVMLQPSRFSGFPPTLETLQIDFAGSVFTFPLNVTGDNIVVLTPTIAVPPADYGAAKDVNADITLNYQFNGVRFEGTLAIMALIFRETGTLHDAVQEIATAEASNVQNALVPRLEALERNVPDTGGESETPRFLDRISPLIDVVTEEADVGEAYFSNSQPANLAAMTRIDPNHNDFTVTGTVAYVAIPAQDGHDHILRNLATGLEQTLTTAGASVDPNLDLIASFGSIFVYEVSGLLAGQTLEIVLDTTTTVVKWPYDILNLSGAIETLRQQFDDRPFARLAENVVSWLLSIVLTEADSTTLVPSIKNVQLSDDDTQFAFLESVPGPAFGGTVLSQTIKAVAGVRRARKLAYIPGVVTATNQDIIVGFSGSLSTPLISKRGNDYVLNQFVPAHGSTSRVVTRYPAQATEISGPTHWQDMPTTTPGEHGFTIPTDPMIIFTRNLPNGVVPSLTIQYRGIGNGRPFGTSQATLANVGDPNSDSETTFVLSLGSETATVTVRWLHTRRVIEVRVVTSIQASPEDPAIQPVIESVQVILSWDETITTPAQGESTRPVVIAPYVPGIFQPFMLAPSDDLAIRADGDTKTLWVATQNGVWDTRWLMNTLFSNDDGGNVRVVIASAEGGITQFFDFEKRELTRDLAQELFNIRNNPYFGLFLTSHQSDTIATFSSSLAFTRHVDTEPGANRDLVAEDLNTIIRLINGGSVAVNIPTNAADPLPIGFTVSVIADGGGSYEIDAPLGVTLNRAVNGTFTVNGQVELTKIGADEWWAVGQGLLSF